MVGANIYYFNANYGNAPYYIIALVTQFFRCDVRV